MRAQSVTAQANNKVIVFDNKIFFNLLMDTLQEHVIKWPRPKLLKNRYEARWLPVLWSSKLDFLPLFFFHLLVVSSAPANYFRSVSRMSSDSEREGPVPGKLRAGSMLDKAEVNTALWRMHDHIIWSHGWIWLWKFWTQELTMKEWQPTIWLKINDCLTVPIDGSIETHQWHN